MESRTSVVLGLTVACLSLVSELAWGQDGVPPSPPAAAPPAPSPPQPAPAPPPPAAPASPPPPAQAEPPVAAAEAVPPNEDEMPNDHRRLNGRLGVTYFDITDLPIANPVGSAGGATVLPSPLTSSTVSAPVVGVRYWVSRRLGIDAGLGIGLAGGADQTVSNGQSTTVSKTYTTGVAIHGGLPIALAEGRHYAFLVIPEMTLGFTTATFKPGASIGPDQDLSGFLLDFGVRVGAEIYFGFIGVPQLALQASVGLSYRRSVYKWSSNGSSSSDGTNTFGTNVNADPWAIFKDAVSATYYF